MNKREEIPKLLTNINFLSDEMKKRLNNEYKTLSSKKVEKVYEFLIKSITKHQEDDVRKTIKGAEKNKHLHEKIDKIHHQESIVHAQELMELAKLEEELNNIIIQ